MPIVFATPGVMDIENALLFGYSHKVNSKSPIGMFGTGLKYAIAGVLRFGGSISISTNNEGCIEINKFTALDDLPGNNGCKVFRNNPARTGEYCAFTTNLGKHWEPWMIYRELYSNTVDENGMIRKIGCGDVQDTHPKRNATFIIVDCPAVENAMQDAILNYNDTDIHIIHSTDQVSVYKAANPLGQEYIYYRGIRIANVKDIFGSGKRTCFIYDIKSDISLTEDRTAKYPWELKHRITCCVASMHTALLVDILFAANTAEYSVAECSEDVVVDRELVKDHHSIVNAIKLAAPYGGSVPTWMRKIALFASIKDSDLSITLDKSVSNKLQLAIKICKSSGFNIDSNKVKIIDPGDKGLLGAAIVNSKNDIYIARNALDYPTIKLAAVIAEEYTHAYLGLHDHSRALQTFLFERVIELGAAKALHRNKKVTLAALLAETKNTEDTEVPF